VDGENVLPSTVHGQIPCSDATFAWVEHDVLPLASRDFVAVDLIRHAPLQKNVGRDGIPPGLPRIYIDVGAFDFLLEDDRRIVPLLCEHNFDLTYHEYGGAHNYTSWRDHVHLGLERMFG
jgi:hypothetical protein